MFTRCRRELDERNEPQRPGYVTYFGVPHRWHLKLLLTYAPESEQYPGPEIKWLTDFKKFDVKNQVFTRQRMVAI